MTKIESVTQNEEFLKKELIRAVENKDIVSVERIINNNNLYLNFQHDNKFLYITALDNFDKDIFLTLLNSGMRVINSGDYLNSILRTDNTGLFSFLLNESNNPKVGCNFNNFSATFWFSHLAKNPESKVLEALIDSNIITNLGINHFILAFKLFAKADKKDLIKKLMKSEGWKSNYQHNNFIMLFSFYMGSLNLKEVELLNEVVSSNPEIKKDWDNLLLNKGKTYRGEIKLNDFSELFYLSRSKNLLEILDNELEVKKLALFLQRPLAFEIFMIRTDRSISNKIIKACLPFMGDFRDYLDNNIAHKILQEMPTKVALNNIYVKQKELLTTPNNEGVTPIDLLSDEKKSFIMNKIIKKTLNDDKIGLIHKKKSTNRIKM